MSEVTANAETVSIDPQDPLPDSNWTYRRVAFLASNFILLGLMAASILSGHTAAMWPLVACFITIWIIYGVAPSGEQVIKGLTMVWGMTKGINFGSVISATSPSGAKATATTTAGAKPGATPSPVQAGKPATGATQEPDPPPMRPPGSEEGEK